MATTGSVIAADAAATAAAAAAAITASVYNCLSLPLTVTTTRPLLFVIILHCTGLTLDF